MTSSTSLSMGWLVAAMNRTSMSSVIEPPIRLISLFCMVRRIFVCIVIGMSPISSRKRVPESACSNTPLKVESAPV